MVWFCVSYEYLSCGYLSCGLIHRIGSFRIPAKLIHHLWKFGNPFLGFKSKDTWVSNRFKSVTSQNHFEMVWFCVSYEYLSYEYLSCGLIHRIGSFKIPAKLIHHLWKFGNPFLGFKSKDTWVSNRFKSVTSQNHFEMVWFCVSYEYLSCGLIHRIGPR